MARILEISLFVFGLWLGHLVADRGGADARCRRRGCIRYGHGFFENNERRIISPFGGLNAIPKATVVPIIALILWASMI